MIRIVGAVLVVMASAVFLTVFAWGGVWNSFGSWSG